MANLVPGCIIRRDDSLDCCLSLAKALLSVSNEKHMLFIFIIGLWGRALLLGPLTPNKYLATRFFFEALLIQTFWSNEHTDIIDSCCLRNINFLFDF
jgi:hypothetical protein